MTLATIMDRVDGGRFRAWSSTLLIASACGCAASLLALVGVLFVPRHDAVAPPPVRGVVERGSAAPAQSNDAGVLLARLASRSLMGAPAASAASDDSSALARVLGTLTLAGTVAEGPAPMAYVMLPGGQMKSVRVGERVLQFTVDAIEKSRVVLRADGNRYVLTYK